jgi:hypothetical protein
LESILAEVHAKVDTDSDTDTDPDDQIKFSPLNGIKDLHVPINE